MDLEESAAEKELARVVEGVLEEEHAVVGG
jgi:hypothetical protein